MHQFLGRLSELDFLYISLHGYDANIEDAAIAHKRSDGSEALPLCPLAAATLFLQPDQKLLHKLAAETIPTGSRCGDIFRFF